MLLGINLAHGSSAALVSKTGQLLFALEEERVSRVKNHIGIPSNAIQKLLTNSVLPVERISEVVVGNTNKYTIEEASIALASLDGNPSNKNGTGMPTRPGFSLGGFHGQSGPDIIQKYIVNLFRNLDISPNFEMTWVKHHDAHLGCSLGAISREKALLLSLDGAGDGESGALAIAEQRRMTRVTSISQLDSLGSLYEAVTNKYNFTPGKHEGKITGLASFGNYSEAVEVFLEYLSVKNGNLTINYAKHKWKAELFILLRRMRIPNKLKLSLKEIVDEASNNTTEYADLAFAVQHILEKSVVEIARFWLEKTGAERLSVSGGVFANVKLNQRLAEQLKIKELAVFPNMGDAGLSVGGVWSQLAKRDSLGAGKLYESMLLSPDGTPNITEYPLPPQVKFTTYEKISLARVAAELIALGNFVAIHVGNMEFGPRALGARSILLDPRKRDILKSANERLRRTEFMPFAPVILAPYFNSFFHSLSPHVSYSDMTITCNVVPEKRASIPAVTHVDGTARPQSIPQDDSLYSLVIQKFHELTGIPLLVNTSFNIHEEPINYHIKDSINCLMRGAVDYVLVEDGILQLKDKI